MMLELKAPETVPVVVPAPEEDVLITGQVQEQNICCVCGGEYTSDSLFCPWCGNKLTT
jgi:predicted amidophosphoribosyltransferase